MSHLDCVSESSNPCDHGEALIWDLCIVMQMSSLCKILDQSSNGWKIV